MKNLKKTVLFILSTINQLWKLIGITIIIFVFSELFFLLYSTITEKNFKPATGANIFQDSTWAMNYFKEYQKSDTYRWSSYVYWKRKKFKGKYINIDSNGIRYTWHPDDIVTANADAVRIFMFGASTLW